MGSFVGRGNQYIQLVKVLYCKVLTIGNQLPTFPHKVRDLNHRPQRWEVSVLVTTAPPWPHNLYSSISAIIMREYESFLFYYESFYVT